MKTYLPAPLSSMYIPEDRVLAVVVRFGLELASSFTETEGGHVSIRIIPQITATTSYVVSPTGAAKAFPVSKDGETELAGVGHAGPSLVPVSLKVYDDLPFASLKGDDYVASSTFDMITAAAREETSETLIAKGKEGYSVERWKRTTLANLQKLQAYAFAVANLQTNPETNEVSAVNPIIVEDRDKALKLLTKRFNQSVDLGEMGMAEIAAKLEEILGISPADSMKTLSAVFDDINPASYDVG